MFMKNAVITLALVPLLLNACGSVKEAQNGSSLKVWSIDCAKVINRDVGPGYYWTAKVSTYDSFDKSWSVHSSCAFPSKEEVYDSLKQWCSNPPSKNSWCLKADDGSFAIRDYVSEYRTPTQTPDSRDSDGDGIFDKNDSCPSQKENYNDYQDGDGCPDSIPPKSYSVMLKTRANYFLNSFDSKGDVSAQPSASRNPAFSDEIFTLVDMNGGYLIEGDAVYFKTRAGYYFNSYDSKGKVSAKPQASMNPAVSDEIFTVHLPGNSSGRKIQLGSQILIKTRAGYYFNSFDSKGSVQAQPTAHQVWGISDELFQIDMFNPL